MTLETQTETLIKIITSYFLSPLIFIIVSIYDYLIGNCAYSYRPVDYKMEIGKNSWEKHKQKVEAVQKQIKSWNENGRKNYMCTGRPTWQTMSVHNINKKNFTQIKLADLHDIIQIDTENKIVTVEPGMSMGRLTSILTQMGFTIPVVPELELLTVGGCICGAGLETSSHKYGLFADTAISFEFILANGDLVNCSQNENTDLFHCIPMSHGTLGFLTAIQFPLIPATKYIKLDYYAVKTIESATKLLQNEGIEFIEGIIYEKDLIVIMYGNMVDEKDVPLDKVNYINKWYKPWFYKHVHSLVKTSSTVTTTTKALQSQPKQANNNNQPPIITTEYIPLRDYYHRHSRSYFWETPTMLPFGDNFLFLFFFGWIYPINYQIMKRLSTKYLWDLFCVKNHVLQDFVVPIEKLKDTLEFSDDLVKIYPIWLCPCIFLNKPGRGKAEGEPASMLIDIGLYGITPKQKEFEPEITTRKMEQFTIKNKGFQGTYADIYMTRTEFEEMFSGMTAYYQNIRIKYGCIDAFPDVYDKISLAARGRRRIKENENCTTKKCE